MSNVLGLTKNNHKYKNVPDKLKWAIPIQECVSRPEVVRQGKMLEALVDQKIAQEARMKTKEAMSLVSKPEDV